MENKKQPLLVTTAHKGVFFGYGKPSTGEVIVLERARMCVYWDQSVKGVFGLAVMGPSIHCRIGPSVSRLHLRNVTSVSEVSQTAEAAWKNSKWD